MLNKALGYNCQIFLIYKKNIYYIYLVELFQKHSFYHIYPLSATFML